jgi:hypothetical protein
LPEANIQHAVNHTVEGGQDGALAGCGLIRLGEGAVAGGQGEQGHAVQFVAQGAPGIGGGVLGDSDERQRQPAQLHVAADAVLAAVMDWA